MLPHTNHFPSSPRESLVGVPVPGPIRFDLGPPPSGVRLRPRRMLRTAMPKTPVDEDRDPRARENEIRLAPRGGIRPDVHAKPESQTMEA